MLHSCRRLRAFQCHLCDLILYPRVLCLAHAVCDAARQRRRFGRRRIAQVRRGDHKDERRVLARGGGRRDGRADVADGEGSHRAIGRDVDNKAVLEQHRRDVERREHADGRTDRQMRHQSSQLIFRQWPLTHALHRRDKCGVLCGERLRLDARRESLGRREDLRTGAVPPRHVDALRTEDAPKVATRLVVRGERSSVESDRALF
mmetsp:Transcript_34302/g.86113  ORF Transcript_34302/g.86113 Transcript_34302/m.86113 type:complete len:204 (+) Transcript_34302:346-957(+)